MSETEEDQAVNWLVDRFSGDCAIKWIDPVAIRALIAELEAERDALKAKVAHLDKLADLYPISLGNACEDRDKLKHSDRALRKENAALRKAMEDAPHELHKNLRRCDCWKSRIPLPTDQTLAQGRGHADAAGNNSAIAHEDIEDREQPDKWR